MKTDYPGRTSCGCPYINRPDPADHYPECHYRLNAEVKPSEPQGGEDLGEVVHIGQVSLALLHMNKKGMCSVYGHAYPDTVPMMTVAQHRRLMAEQLELADGIADLCRFLAKLYCELDELRYPTAKLPPEQIAEHMLFRWPVLQGTRNQISIKRISEQPYDQEALHAGIAAMLVRAQEKNHGK
jgi:hypothetical protein